MRYPVSSFFHSIPGILMALFLPGICCVSMVCAQNISEGQIQSFNFADSKIFPGITRKVSVYIPAGINPQDTLCVYIQQDGLKRSERVPHLLDSLIGSNVIPPLVGIFVYPGVSINKIEGNRPRPSRSLQYDGLGDAYARFLLEELLPFVSEKFDLNLSNQSNDRAIGGMSSGGIAAFNAAWERPDAFSRVYSCSGSFVAFRGGEIFPDLVRKSEPRRIRTFMTVGNEDMENAAGDWTLANHQMAKALKYAGYDSRFKELTGGHVVGYEETFAEAMAYLWEDWPRQVAMGAGNPHMTEIIYPEAEWQKIEGAYPAGGHPVFNSKGEIFYAVGKRIMRIGTNGEIADSGIRCRNEVLALAVGSADQLYALESGGRIMVVDTAGKSSIFAEQVQGSNLIARPDGGIYISGDKAGGTGHVYFINQAGKTEIFDVEASGVSGLAVTPDHRQLAVAESNSRWIWNFEIAPPGQLLNGERFFRLANDNSGEQLKIVGMNYSQEGYLVVGTQSQIQFCADNGRVVAILEGPGEQIKGNCFGGKSLSKIYAFCEDGIYVRDLLIHGTGAFTPWMRMRKIPLR